MRLILALLLAANAFAGYDSHTLNVAWTDAENAWKLGDDGLQGFQGFEFVALSTCRAAGQQAMWSDPARGVIVINPKCRWNQKTLTAAFTHEIAHWIIGPSHSLNPRSVRFWMLRRGQHILTEDWRALAAAPHFTNGPQRNVNNENAVSENPVLTEITDDGPPVLRHRGN